MKKSVLSIVIVVAIIAAMFLVAYFGVDLGFYKIPSLQDGVTLSLDLVGGSEIVYEANIPEGTSDEDVASGMESAQSMLRQRLTALGYTEANVYMSGDTRLAVEIPAVDDPEEAVQMLGTTAVVEFRDADGKVWLEGGDIDKAEALYDYVDDSGVAQYHVRLTFTEAGRQKFTEATKYAATLSSTEQNYISIVMDDNAISEPFVDSKYATTGIDSETAIITFGSNATSESTSYLANIINAGALPFTLTNIKLQSVGASLGERSLETSLIAGLIGIVLVMLFMIIVYKLPGLVSAVTLLFYGGLFAVVLAVGGVNLSLPGVAGIILTVGMAVDANVIIFERIKEELRAGKTLRSSIDSGYHRAFTAILDSNVTTAIAAIVLWWQGTGTITGFAKTLLIGVIISMFCMLVITKILLKSLVGLKVTNIKAYGA